MADADRLLTALDKEKRKAKSLEKDNMEVRVKMDDEIKAVSDKFSKEIGMWKDKLEAANKEKTQISDRFLEMKLK